MKHKKTLFWALTVLWMIIIFSLSAQPAVKSTETSSVITDIMIKLFYPEFQSSTPETQALIIDSCQHNVRKTAHFIEYAVLGFLCLGACLSTFKRKNFWIALSICILYSISDEVHQIFVPGRAGRFSDVLIDSFGALAGILVYIWLSGKIRFLQKNEGNYEKN